MTKEVIWTDRLMVPIAHFSHAVRIGNMIHVGATAGTDAKRHLAGSTPGRVDAVAQTERMFENLETILGLLGAGLTDVVRLKTYVADPRDMAVYGEIYERRFGDIRPTHSVIGSWGFPLPQAGIELDAVAAVGTDVARLTEAALAAVDQGSSPAGVRVGDEHHGTALPLRQDGTITAGDVVAQTRAALQNLAAMLAAAGLAPSEVVNLHVTLSDLRDLPAFEAGFRQMFDPPYPSRTIVGAPLQRPEMLVQIESIAVAGGGQPVDDPALPNVLGCASPAMVAGDMLYVSGQFRVGPDGTMVAGAEAQTRAAWTRMHCLMEAADFPPESVLRTNNVLTDWRSYAGFNAGYGAATSDPYPPRATVLGQLVDPRALVQVEAIAHRRGHQATIVQAAGFR